MYTGNIDGACAVLERKTGKMFLHLACRHHISELILRNVVRTYWKGTSGSNVLDHLFPIPNWEHCVQISKKLGNNFNLKWKMLLLQKLWKIKRRMFSNSFHCNTR